MQTALKVSADVADTWIQYKQDRTNEALRNRLVEKYLPEVKRHAQRIWRDLPGGIELDDLVSAGVFGLIQAIDAYDLQRGIKFETFLTLRVCGAMLDELRAMDWAPRLVRSKASKVKAARQELEDTFGRPATEREIASKLGLSLEQLARIQMDTSAAGQVSLHRKCRGTESDKCVYQVDLLTDIKSEDPTLGTRKKDTMKLIMKGLNRRERLIIILYYYEGLSMKEIGGTLELTESRVSQIHRSVVRRLQQDHIHTL